MVSAAGLIEENAARRSRWLCRALLVALVLATFGRLLTYDYAQWDDGGTIFTNPLHYPVTSNAFASAWTQPRMVIYIPITHTAWAVLAAIGAHETPEGPGISAVPFRVVSLLVHACSTLVAFEIVRRLVGSLPAALFGAAIFAVHPIQVEAVAWISGQKDLFAGFFVLAAAWTAIKAADDEARTPAWSWATWLLGALAMLSKPQAMVAPLLIMVLLRLALSVPWRRTLVVSCPLLLPAAVIAVVARAVQPATIVPDTPIYLRPLIVLDSLAWYAGKLLMPVDLTIDYGRTPRVALASDSIYVGAFAIAVVIVVAWWLRRRQPLVAAGLAIAAIGPLPVLGLTRFDFQYYSTVADHYLYTGMLGIAMSVAALYRLLPSRSLQTAGFLVLLPLAVLASRQAGLWHNTQSLFGHNLAVTPRGLGPNRVLGFAAAQRGDDKTAVEFLKVALQNYPRDAMANYNLANALVRLGDAKGAAAAFQIAIEANPKKPEYRHNYAILLIGVGQLDEAERQLELAIETDPRARASVEALAKLRAMLSRPTP